MNMRALLDNGRVWRSSERIDLGGKGPPGFVQRTTRIAGRFILDGDDDCVGDLRVDRNRLVCLEFPSFFHFTFLDIIIS